eukprot:CAMPEP_0115583130 /NCGR_PEP_ID=MMETSP0272-20121206/6014_1 /TAXON_ID=71861 /ORGANISM="Scrippsiella trochoidea, Strain CCMP3099" /LENGTH=367 /DNA_ID=CAMNT_0003018133 /DNA_START=70 /DNA_END=1174 /DNA_ORIENTATION=+
MGCCAAKGLHSQNQVVERDRRRLSVNKAEDVANAPKTDVRGNVATSLEGNILDLFPDAQRRTSVTGAVPPDGVQQKGFADKPTRKGGDEGLKNFKVGCACKKGLKPESPNQDDFASSEQMAPASTVFSTAMALTATMSPLLFKKPSLGASRKTLNLLTIPRRLFVQHSPRQCTESQTEFRFDCSLSGTTATMAMHRDGALYIGHVGDSRAVLAKRRCGGELRAEDLTEDHKPTCESERRRIQAAGGQVRRLDGDIPHRVFLSGKMYPGLAMTRSIGDTVGVTAGVTSNPDVRALKVQRDWRFLLLCSDGIWEFITSQEAVDIIGKYPASEVQKAVDSLASEAWNRWIQEEGDVVDDITVICAWFGDD